MNKKETDLMQMLIDVEQKGEACHWSTYFTSVEAALARVAEPDLRMGIAYQAGTRACNDCGDGTRASHFFELVAEAADQKAFLDESSWRMLAFALENRMILATSEMDHREWVEKLRRVDPSAEVLRAYVGQLLSMCEQGLSWEKVSISTAYKYYHMMNRPGWTASILNRLTTSCSRCLSHAVWRNAILLHVWAVRRLAVGTAHDAIAKGESFKDRLDFILQPSIRALSDFLSVFPADPLVESDRDSLSRLPEKLLSHAMRDGASATPPETANKERTHNARDISRFPPIWRFSPELVHEIHALGMSGMQFHLEQLRLGVDMKRSEKPIPCILLSFRQIDGPKHVDLQQTSFALRAAVWITLPYAVNRSGKAWACTMHGFDSGVNLGAGVPTRFWCIGERPDASFRDRILMWCVSDTIEEGWDVEILPHFLPNGADQLLARVNDRLCEVFDVYKTVPLIFYGPPV